MSELARIQAEDQLALQTQLEACTQRIWDLRDQLALEEMSRAAIMNVLKQGAA